MEVPNFIGNRSSNKLRIESNFQIKADFQALSQPVDESIESKLFQTKIAESVVNLRNVLKTFSQRTIATFLSIYGLFMG